TMRIKFGRSSALILNVEWYPTFSLSNASANRDSIIQPQFTQPRLSLLQVKKQMLLNTTQRPIWVAGEARAELQTLMLFAAPTTSFSRDSHSIKGRCLWFRMSNSQA
ncbi:MAG TPA: hypothetical protein PLY87_30925, partial [Planctomycetaceae bacterium]|nr:hypothetical protein [Planctomycetaceae bacterium]